MSCFDTDSASAVPSRSDEDFMRTALRLAEMAGERGEVPIGAVAVKEGRIIAKGWNQVETLKDGTAHAELLAMTAAAVAVGDWRLDGVTIYVTKEPCAMCAGALVNTRVDRVVYGMPDPRSGCAGSALNVTGFPGMLHRVQVTGGILEEECRRLIRDFFQQVRKK